MVIAGGELAGGHSYVQVHDSRTGKKLTTISPLDEPAYSPSFSPDGTLIMATVGSIDSFDSADNINRVVVWDVETGQERFSLRDHRAGDVRLLQSGRENNRNWRLRFCSEALRRGERPLAP